MVLAALSKSRYGVGIDLGKCWADQPSDSLRSMGSVEVEMA